MIGLCAICASDGAGEIREHDGRDVFVCDRCENEHPRDGGYSFEGQAPTDEGGYRMLSGHAGRGASSTLFGQQNRAVRR